MRVLVDFFEERVVVRLAVRNDDLLDGSFVGKVCDRKAAALRGSG